MNGRRRRWLLWWWVAAALAAAGLMASEGWVGSRVAGRMAQPEDAPPREVALVLGAPPGRLLEARMEAACQLVALRTVATLILSGMPDELPLMTARARSCVAEDRILVDDGAARTLHSFLRTRSRFGVGGALVVSQAYHLPRALYLADAVGFDAFGVVAAGEPSLRGRARESLATLRALWDVRRLDPKP